ncbi:TlpA family protein disulfide reductase [Chengkuizengella sp. SCS-71B]|uniref:TlpA family protein disulfide reductase n=1 Tax=Chengkuizengella sp. SCS-71B TaxID=3115290 RepID=UPI0032C24B46
MNKNGIWWVIIISVVGVLYILANGLRGVEVPEIGEVAYDFKLYSTDDEIYRLSDFKGQYVVLNFFATWCFPCQDEEPELEKFHQKYGEEYPLLIIDRSEPKNRILEFKEEYDSTTTYLMDKDDKVSQYYGVRGQPETFIITPEGILLEKIIGPTTSEDLASKIYLATLNNK